MLRGLRQIEGVGVGRAAGGLLVVGLVSQPMQAQRQLVGLCRRSRSAEGVAAMKQSAVAQATSRPNGSFPGRP